MAWEPGTKSKGLVEGCSLFQEAHLLQVPQGWAEMFSVPSSEAASFYIIHGGPHPLHPFKARFLLAKACILLETFEYGSIWCSRDFSANSSKKVLAEGWTTRRSTCCLQELSRPWNGPHPKLCKTLPEAQLPGSLFLWVGRGI